MRVEAKRSSRFYRRVIQCLHAINFIHGAWYTLLAIFLPATDHATRHISAVIDYLLIGIPYLVMSIIIYRYCCSNVILLQQVIQANIKMETRTNSIKGDRALQEISQMFQA